MTPRKPCKENRPEVEPASDACRALYVHVPFCPAKCRYCDFYSLPAAEHAARGYVDAALTELRRRRGDLTVPLESVFVGGGTPTALPPGQLARLLEALAPLIDASTEVSVEANPGTVDRTVAALLADRGVTRVNIGVQSFDASELALLGRVHDADGAGRAVADLRAVGITNLGMDLIYGIPGQTLSTWRSSVAAATALAPEHLSCYALSFEAGTPLARDLAAGRLAAMDEAEQEACYRHAIAAAGSAGLEHYEIANFARPGRRCRHNLTYWRNRPYVGLGPAAASYVGGVRRTTIADLWAWQEALARGAEPPGTSERLTGRAAMAETVMLALRLGEGVNRRAFARRYGLDVLDAFAGSLAGHVEAGRVEIDPARVRLASAWLFLADSVLADVVTDV